MAGSPEDLDALRAQVAALTARVYQLEQRAGIALERRPPPTAEASHPVPAAPPAGTMLQPPAGQAAPSAIPPALSGQTVPGGVPPAPAGPAQQRPP